MQVNDVKKLLVRLLTWVFYTLFFSLLPFGLIYFIEINKGKVVDMAFLFARGELIIVSLTLCAVALGDLLNFAFVKKELESLGAIIAAAIVVGFCAVLIITTASFYYAAVIGGGLKVEWIIFTSKFLLGFSIITCSACIVITERGD